MLQRWDELEPPVVWNLVLVCQSISAVLEKEGSQGLSAEIRDTITRRLKWARAFYEDKLTGGGAMLSVDGIKFDKTETRRLNRSSHSDANTMSLVQNIGVPVIFMLIGFVVGRRLRNF